MAVERREERVMAIGTMIAQGAIGGASGAGCMTALRMAARRMGWIDATPPQATRDWLGERVGQPGSAGARQLFDASVHLGVGVAGGMAYGSLISQKPRAVLPSGSLFGLGVWALGFGVVAPALGITRSPRRATWRETGVNVAAHLVYGIVTALVATELRRQTHGSDAGLRTLRARIG
jgi:uncharacterized membrane protein YagU involved in acid resistance